MTYRIILFLLLFSLVTNLIHAQRPVKIGFQVLSGYSKVVNYYNEGNSTERRWGYEWGLGPTLEIPVSNQLSMQTGFRYMRLKTEYYPYNQSELNIRYFAVPVDFKYYFKQSGNSYFIYGGATQWLGMKQTVTLNNPPLTTNAFNDYRKRDLMGQIGVGRNFILKNNSAFQVSVLYAGNPSVHVRSFIHFFKIDNEYFGLSHLMIQMTGMF